MERKIGEIFEYNGEWYQCLPEILICVGCAFKNKTCKKIRGIRGECERASRQTDGVIFKKLKKVGEPFKSSDFDDRIVMLQSYKMFTKPYILGVVCYIHYDTNIIDIEIKQTKEDMEEYKMHDAKEDIPEFDKVVDECLFGKDKLNLKPFDIQKAKEGKPVCTKDGRKARIICFDRNDLYPIVALIECKDGKEIVGAYSNGGKTEIYEIKGTDLMMLPEKKEGWVNIYYEHNAPSHREASWVYDKEEEAIKIGKEHGSSYIATVRIEWEE